MSRKITVKCFCASDGICNRYAQKNPPSAFRQTAEGIYSVCRKSLFFKKCLFSIPIPFRTLCWLCFVQSLVCPYFGVLAENPNPFPSVKGSVCLVGSASCRAFGHTRPASVPGLNVGLPPSPSKDALAVSRTQSLHDAATPTTDNPHWGYAPNPIFRVM